MELKPCPFCGADLEPFGPAQHNHPRNHCWLRAVRIMDVDRASWNSRPPSTLAQQVAAAQSETATWSQEKRDSVRLAGSSEPTRGSIGRKE